MESGGWAENGYSPKVKDGPSPYFHDLDHLQGNEHNNNTVEVGGIGSVGSVGSGGGAAANNAAGGDHNVSEHVANKFSELEHFFLQQIEHNLYSAGGAGPGTDDTGDDSHGSHGGVVYENGQSEKYNFGVENINFMLPEEMPFELQPSSSAFPPTATIISTNTPNMRARNSNAGKDKATTTATMFVSPILPGQNEKSYNNQHYYHKHQKYRQSESQTTLSYPTSSQHVKPEAVFTPLVSPASTPLDSQVNLNLGQFSKPLLASFEPLTSPALNAQSDKRRSSSSVYAPSEGSVGSHKRRTPHGTPVLQAHNQRVKISPALKTKNQKNLGNSTFEKLPESSIDRPAEESMLPPSSKNVDVGGDDHPATLMGFTMKALADKNIDNSELTKPKGGHMTRSRSLRRNSSTSLASKLVNKSSSSGESSPLLRLNSTHNSNAGSSTSLLRPKSEKPATKKASHKLAEQGRRNRMNQAVQELSNLIPQSYHDEVTIPSKATTVELASKFIRNLLKENEDLKQ